MAKPVIFTPIYSHIHKSESEIASEEETTLTVFGAIANCKVIGYLPKIGSLLDVYPSFTRLKNDPRYDIAISDRIGRIKINHLLAQPFIRRIDIERKVLGEIKLKDISHIPSILSEFLFSYLNCIWLQFDNCFMVRSVYAHSSIGKLAFNEFPGVLTTANGQFTIKPLTIENIRQAEKDFEIIKTWDVIKEGDQEPRPEIGNMTYIPIREKFYSYNKLIRAYLLLTQARLSQVVPIKLTFYVVALECLFSNDDKSEVNHKVSERASHFIGETADERVELFKMIKKLYDVRSKFVHGQSIKLPIKDLGILSVEIDTILRRIFRKLINNKEIADIFLGSQNMLDEYYLKMIFSV